MIISTQAIRNWFVILWNGGSLVCITATAGSVNYACGPLSGCVCGTQCAQCGPRVWARGWVLVFTWVFWLCECFEKHSDKAPDLMLSSCGMQQDQLFLNHMTPLLPPSGLPVPSHLPVEPFTSSQPTQVGQDVMAISRGWPLEKSQKMVPLGGVPGLIFRKMQVKCSILSHVLKDIIRLHNWIHCVLYFFCVHKC